MKKKIFLLATILMNLMLSSCEEIYPDWSTPYEREQMRAEAYGYDPAPQEDLQIMQYMVLSKTPTSVTILVTFGQEYATTHGFLSVYVEKPYPAVRTTITTKNFHKEQQTTEGKIRVRSGNSYTVQVSFDEPGDYSFRIRNYGLYRYGAKYEKVLKYAYSTQPIAFSVYEE